MKRQIFALMIVPIICFSNCFATKNEETIEAIEAKKEFSTQIYKVSMRSIILMLIGSGLGLYEIYNGRIQDCGVQVSNVALQAAAVYGNASVCYSIRSWEAKYPHLMDDPVHWDLF